MHSKNLENVGSNELERQRLSPRVEQYVFSTGPDESSSYYSAYLGHDDSNISICQESFQGLVQQHHTPPRPFSCGKCDRTFARRHDRERHQKGHLGEQRYVCDNGGCGKHFTRAEGLRNHFKSEIGMQCKARRSPGENQHGQHHEATVRSSTDKCSSYSTCFSPGERSSSNPSPQYRPLPTATATSRALQNNWRSAEQVTSFASQPQYLSRMGMPVTSNTISDKFSSTALHCKTQIRSAFGPSNLSFIRELMDALNQSINAWTAIENSQAHSPSTDSAKEILTKALHSLCSARNRSLLTHEECKIYASLKAQVLSYNMEQEDYVSRLEELWTQLAIVAQHEGVDLKSLHPFRLAAEMQMSDVSDHAQMSAKIMANGRL
ncbi:hypothetical protein EJ08DRAFT_258888 [Tothia fuscella]|uniref:C2H2-type domain-containing protein n=1 Tax=Tothia fuscella TaxID=1048955 RepID=A0A9P4TXX3_9PEZI|nr:hypothetical protein EJ08DRAFT_258888 [Tothia fuscella]